MIRPRCPSATGVNERPERDSADPTAEPRGPRRVPPALSRLPALRSPRQRLPPYRRLDRLARGPRPSVLEEARAGLASLNVFRFDLCFVTNN
jgi:hypothetical protein